MSCFSLSKKNSHSDIMEDVLNPGDFFHQLLIGAVKKQSNKAFHSVITQIPFFIAKSVTQRYQSSHTK